MKATFCFCLLIVNNLLNIVTAQSVAATDTGFLLPVEDVFSISGRGTVIVGKIERGIIKTGDSATIAGMGDKVFKTVITGIESFGRILTEAKKGDNVGLLVRGVERNDVSRGMIVGKPGSVKAHTIFRCNLELFSKENGGRSTPVFDKYRPQFVFYTAMVSGEISLPAGRESLQPGSTSSLSAVSYKRRRQNCWER